MPQSHRTAARSARRPRRPTLAAALAAATLATAPAAAWAQIVEGEGRPGMELRLFRPAVDSQGLFTVNASPVLPHLDISFGLILDYAYAVARLDDPFAARRSLVEHAIWGTLHFDLGLYNFAVIGVQVPVGLNFGRTFGDEPGQWGGDLARAALRDGWQSSMVGDVSIHAKFRLLRRERFPVGLAAIVQTQLMSGDAAGLLGDPGRYGLTAVAAQVVVDREASRRFRWALNVGYRLVLADGPTITTPAGRTFRYDDQVTFGLGASYEVARGRLELVGEVYGNTSIASFGRWSDGGVPLEVATGLRIFVERNSYLYLGVASGAFSPGYSASALRVFAAWIFEPSIGDRDGDGIKDDVDECPDDPEDLDDFLDVDGCPDPDNDRDGILDVDDECPFVPEDRDGEDDEDGCPDGDEGDRDGDGILDSVDACPDDPEDIDQFEDEDGCPDPDNDRDGILDVDDLCPDEPEDVDAFDDQDGCPDPDNDEDRVLDVDDECPMRPETYNGVNDDDGCPDQNYAERRGGSIVIMEEIRFERDSANLRSSSFPILDAVAETLANHPDIRLVEIQGHADERASDEYNIRLTRDRAAAVLRYLVEQGRVDARRLRSAGYGERCPVAEGRGEAAWSRNRRVEFKILRTDAGQPNVEIACEAGRELIPADDGRLGGE
jgi:outer membrane protein OmpA-like peptidoglycan-associated protein